MCAHLRRVALLAVALVVVKGPPAHPLDSEAERTIAALGLRPGLRVADVGTGSGEWAERIGREVGETGYVYATEVDPDHLQRVEARLKEAGLKNVATILGTQQNTGLPPECCDAILLRMVYHHFTDPARMRASLRSALRRGGSIVVIDTEPQKNWRHLEGVPDRGGHGIKEEALVREMTGDGFEVVERHDDWPGDGDRYCVVFRRAEGSGPALRGASVTWRGRASTDPMAALRREQRASEAAPLPSRGRYPPTPRAGPGASGCGKPNPREAARRS
jgi:SAM-dependent methyltransferase